jgi:hypothetical protein
MFNFWIWLDGKKTIISTIFWSITMPSLNIIYPDGIPTYLNKTTLIIGTILSALGITHKIVKTNTNQISKTSDKSE